VRSTHNVGSLLRSADGFGLEHVYLTGYTPYPEEEHDDRLPHVRSKLNRQIHKTALGAEKNLSWSHKDSLSDTVKELKKEGYKLVALEQTPNAQDLDDYKPRTKTALIVGNEVNGLDQEALKLADTHVQIPMLGKKESLNVSIAGSIALYRLRQLDKNKA